MKKLVSIVAILAVFALTACLGPVEVNQDPIAAFTYTQDGSLVTFDGTCSKDPDGTIVCWEWQFGGGNTGVGPVVERMFAVLPFEMTLPVILAVQDNDGAWNEIMQLVVIEATIPDPVPDPLPIGFPVAIFTYVQTGSTVVFDASASYDQPRDVPGYADGYINWATWDFGDGTLAIAGDWAYTVAPTHQYTKPGIYEVILTVKDNEGYETSTSRWVIIK